MKPLICTPFHASSGTRTLRQRVLVAASAVLLLQAGCTVPADPAPSDPIVLPECFTASGTLQLQPQWWHGFGDDALNRLIDEALASNLSLQATWERLEQARATAAKSGAARYPDLTFEGSASTNRQFGDTTGSSQSFSMGLAASYELDFWGRVNASAEAAALDLKASKEELRTAALSLSGEVATAWFNLQSQHRQAALLQNQITLNEKHLELTERKFRSGQAKASDVLQQRQSLEASKGEAIQVHKNISLYEHRLALLLGRVPGSLSPEPIPALPEPIIPKTGVPSELLMQRPDVKAAYFALQAADKRLAAAVADRYPRFSIGASIESSALHASDLFNTWLATLAGSLSAPLFDGGLRRAEAQRSAAARNEQFYLYAQTLLDAVKEVEDALSEVAHQRRYVESLERQLELSSAAVAQLREQYLRGSGSFVSFLNAQLSHESLQRNRVSATDLLIEKSITLYRALSTGWEPERQATNQRSADVR